MSRILISSDAVFHNTGYGIQTKFLCQSMLKDGHEPLNYAPGAFPGAEVVVDGVRVLGCNFGDDRWGNATLPHHLLKYKPDLVLTWLDCQGLDYYGLDPTPTYMWAPIDTWPIPFHERSILHRAKKIMVPSKWGLKVLNASGIEGEYLPCGLKMDEWWIAPEDRKEWRQTFKVPEDHFLVGMVGLNSGSPDRKNYGFAMDAFRTFADQHDDVNLFIYTNTKGSDGAIPLDSLREELDLTDKVLFAPEVGPAGVPVSFLRNTYNAIDVLLHMSGCEGFGIPVAEAQACGTPVIACAATSVTELLAPGSVGVDPLTDMFIATSSRIAIPDVEKTVAALEAMYQRWKSGTMPARDPIRRWIAERFDWDLVYETYWKPLLASIPVKARWDDGERKLMLGAGKNQRKGFVHHDIAKLHDHIDVTHDLNVFPWPWADDSWDYIEMEDVMEHLPRENLVRVMDELWRIIAPGGYLFIHTARAGSWQHHMDPTHTQGFMLESFDYFDPDTPFGRGYHYSEHNWHIELRTESINKGLMFVLSPTKTADVAVPA